ncbi:GNAT family N-acetyltransferase [Treponema sp. OMZ 788]|uniref:GNAT family N-acetyltransferase n=1 Tax=Treponema sp. OMZ 788 TaxID=2563664 RepID=UPI0020A241E9|nr:GNAT family N-acetyltransferase [Treponema sp. OMZ 788]UTC65366.1 GNAT family N-acetyltransferase [Treponema sp. OMZ 788]
MKKIRQAQESDRNKIVDCILDAFQKDFSEFINKVGKNKVESFLTECIRINCFYLIETEQEIIGVLALSDIKGRAINGAKKAAQKYFGAFVGRILYMANFKDFEINYCKSETIGFIEFAAVRQKFQGRGIASFLITKVISETSYTNYLLDVVDTNYAAINCYTKLGFIEIKRDKVMFGKQKGFKEKIFMEYKKEDE